MDTGEKNSSPEKNYKEPVGGGKRDRTPCADASHDWECEKASCPDCWVPRCEPNAQKEQDAYDSRKKASPAGAGNAAHKEHIRARIEAGEDEVGLEFEEKVLDKVASEGIDRYSYFAHCTKCHVQAEIDIVTSGSVLECKHSAAGFNLKQMQTRVIPIAKKCFPGKRVVCATRESELPELRKKLIQWKKHLGVVLEAIGT